jgi:hypothetical protein
MARRPTSRTATYLLRMTPDEKAALEKMAKHSGMTLADALRDGAHDYLRKLNLQVVADHRQRGHAAAR